MRLHVFEARVSFEREFHGGKFAHRVITTGDADTSFYADVPVKPNTQYRLAGWIRTRGLRPACMAAQTSR